MISAAPSGTRAALYPINEPNTIRAKPMIIKRGDHAITNAPASKLIHRTES
jgi:hypothetical protein